ncbi:triggering receptor expressed on myeloid cells 2 precursor [Xenopus tropicalis]|uniref:Trem2 protein n=1 Tax=Xenopus tropicalis TaxID=8364 RepID=A8E5U2_XENTR|eukprot:NP_001103522.1 triggering receptor expressed on myeloid cells 2 precursor [Xenopus tropicalis]
MHPLFKLILLMCLLDICLAQNVTVLSGQLGDTLTILCPYKQRADRWRKKLWCKEDSANHCQPVVTARRFWLQLSKRSNGSTSISDNIHEGLVIVTISHLRHDDSGMYQCQSHSSQEVDILQRVQLHVVEETMRVNISDVANVQHSISGFSARLRIPLSLTLLGCSFLVSKVILLGLTFIWLNSRHKSRANLEPTLIASSEESVLGESRNVCKYRSSEYGTEVYNNTPVYINYMYTMANLN